MSPVSPAPPLNHSQDVGLDATPPASQEIVVTEAYRLGFAYAASPQALLDDAGRLRDANQAFVACFGPGQDLSRLLGLTQALIPTISLQPGPWLGLRCLPDGKACALKLSLSQIPGQGWLLEIRDQTELAAALQQQRQVQRTYQGVLDSAPDLMCALTPDFRVLAINRKYQQETLGRFGIWLSAGDDYRAAFEPLGGHRALTMWETSFTGNDYDFQLQYAPPGESMRYYDGASRVLRDAQGRTLGAVHRIHDISEAIRANRHQSQLIKELYESQAAKDLFLHTASHDLRSPLSNLIDLSELLAEELPQLEQRPDYRRLRATLLRMQATLDGLVELVASQQAEQLVRPVQLPQLLTTVLQELGPQIHAAQAEIVQHLAVEELPYIASFLESMLRNLIGNALKYSDHSRRPQLEVRSCPGPDGAVLLSVRDNGLGLDLAQAGERLFRPFQRFHPERPGRGLGLYLIRTMAEKNGGTIRFESTPGQGSLITLALIPYRHEPPLC